MAFDLLWLDGQDLRGLPLYQRKRRLARIMPRIPSRVRLVEQIQRCSVDFFNVACQHDLEGIVAKWRTARIELTDAPLEDPKSAVLAADRARRRTTASGRPPGTKSSMLSTSCWPARSPT